MTRARYIIPEAICRMAASPASLRDRLKAAGTDLLTLTMSGSDHMPEGMRPEFNRVMRLICGSDLPAALNRLGKTVDMLTDDQVEHAAQEVAGLLDLLDSFPGPEPRRLLRASEMPFIPVIKR